jgi:hypothetical protein
MRFNLCKQSKTVRRAGLPVYAVQIGFHRFDGYKEAFRYLPVGFTL